jgi:signal transduction histidine kinase
MEEASEFDLSHESLIHDLNNVFETVTEAAELLSADEQWQSLAATLNRSIARGKRLLGAIPDQTPELNAVLDDATQSVTDYCAAGRRPCPKFHRETPEAFKLPGSAKDWERVFVNLFLNSAQVMQKPGRIDVAAQKTPEGLAITVADNGPGIPEDILPRVFRPNVSTKTQPATRTGLGLHIVHTLVKKNAGRVSAANREGGPGAIFSIQLPFA